MVISTDFVIALFCLAFVGIIAIGIYVFYIVYTIIDITRQQSVKKANFESSLCFTCRKKMDQYKLNKLRD